LTILFLTPPFRRPYELYYFCNFSDDVIVVVDKETFNRYSDSFDEFKDFKFRYVFIPIEIEKLSKIMKLGSTAALISYSEMQLEKIIVDKKVTTIVSVEIFSSLSLQASRLSTRLSLKHVVIIWENIKKSIFYFIPPFSINTKIVKSTASKFIAVSETSKKSMTTLYIDDDKIETVYPGILIDKFQPSIDSADKILFVGNLEPNKGIHILLKAFKKLSDHFSGIKLVIVGRGSLESKVIKFKDSGLKIDYRGYIPGSKISSIYSDCSIFCSPSVIVKRIGLILTWQEQFGFTLVEAMASGLPIVSSNIGAIPEIIGKENLIITPKVDNIFYALRTLLTSDGLRKRLRENNRQRSKVMFDALKQSMLFERAINRPF
jgi:glycosyltransferase involved in cell wall biosynthesis